MVGHCINKYVKSFFKGERGVKFSISVTALLKPVLHSIQETTLNNLLSRIVKLGLTIFNYRLFE